MSDDRLTEQVLCWDKLLNDAGSVYTWYSEVKQILYECNFQNIYENGCRFPLKSTIDAIKNTMKLKLNYELKNKRLPMPK